MANHASAVKAARQALRHQERNKRYQSMMKTALKKIRSSSKKSEGESLLPKTANLFGVIPHSEIRNRIAERAMQFMSTVTMESKNKMKLFVRCSAFFNVSATEKRIIAITPRRTALNITRKFLSVYGFFPVNKTVER